MPPKCIQTETRDHESIQSFIREIYNTGMMLALDKDLYHDPNHNYNKMENIVRRNKDKHLPITTVRFNKYKHKLSS